MAVIKIYDLVRKRVLVTRDEARSLRSLFSEATRTANGLVLDFSGVEGVTPSFVDELLAVLKELTPAPDTQGTDVVLLNPPTRLSSKFTAIGKGRGLKIEERAGEWRISRAEGAEGRP